MKAYFSLTTMALVFAALCGAALAFDGSTYLYAILESQAPHIPNDRLINVLLHWPTLLMSHLTSNMAILRAVFGLVYAAIPVISLVASWWVVRERHPHLFVWPALCIGLGTLPGQFYLVSEGMYSTQLFWPIILSIALRLPRQHIPLVAALTVAVLFAHPFALLLIAFAMVQAFIFGVFCRKDRQRMWLCAAGFCAILALAGLKFAISKSGYEAEQLSFAILLRDFNASVTGLPLISLIFTWMAALMIFVNFYISDFSSRSLLFGVTFIELVCILSAGLSLIVWASIAQNWTWASGFRPFALFNSLLFMTLAGAESLLCTVRTRATTQMNWLHRLRTIQIVATIFLLVLCIQGVIWLSVTNRLRDTLFRSSWSCMSMSSISWLATTPLSWATPILSIVLQDRVPERLVLPGDSCAQLDASAPIHLTQFDQRDWSGGWFDFSPLRRVTITEREVDRRCWYVLTSGWYGAQSLGTEYWWRWSSGRGQFRVFVDRDTHVVLQGEIESIQYPNRVDILINGEVQAAVNITWSKMGPLEAPSLSLHAGANTIEFVSHNSSIKLSDNDRPLAIAVANLGLLTTDTGFQCDLHP